MEGTVKYFNESKGYGFIQQKDRGVDVFFHKIELNRSGIYKVQIGDIISYEIQQNQKGLYAVNIRKT